MDTPEGMETAPGASVLATIRILARAMERARQAQATPSSWVLCPPYPQQMDEIRTAPFRPDGTAHLPTGPVTVAEFAAMALRADGPGAPQTTETRTADGGLVIQFADPEDPRRAGGGTLVLTAEALRHFALNDPSFPWETFPDIG